MGKKTVKNGPLRPICSRRFPSPTASKGLAGRSEPLQRAFAQGWRSGPTLGDAVGCRGRAGPVRTVPCGSETDCLPPAECRATARCLRRVSELPRDCQFSSCSMPTAAAAHPRGGFSGSQRHQTQRPALHPAGRTAALRAWRGPSRLSPQRSTLRGLVVLTRARRALAPTPQAYAALQPRCRTWLQWTVWRLGWSRDGGRCGPLTNQFLPCTSVPARPYTMANYLSPPPLHRRFATCAPPPGAPCVPCPPTRAPCCWTALNLALARHLPADVGNCLPHKRCGCGAIALVFDFAWTGQRFAPTRRWRRPPRRTYAVRHAHVSAARAARHDPTRFLQPPPVAGGEPLGLVVKNALDAIESVLDPRQWVHNWRPALRSLPWRPTDDTAPPSGSTLLGLLHARSWPTMSRCSSPGVRRRDVLQRGRGGDVPHLLRPRARAAHLALDGCPMVCVKSTLARTAFCRRHYQLPQYGGKARHEDFDPVQPRWAGAVECRQLAHPLCGPRRGAPHG